MNNTLISIIVPCYNQAQYLSEALQSVLEQTHENWECIIVNDGSPDDTEVIAKRWLEKDSRFKYIYKENGGLSSARNVGLGISNGDYIQFLDSDDILECNKLQCQSQFFYKNIDVLISGYRYFEDKEGVSNLRIIGRNNFIPETIINYDDTTDLKKLFDIKNPFVICAPLYKKSIFHKIGNFDEQLNSLEDWDFNLRCAINDISFHHIGYFPKSKVLVRLHENSMMRKNDVMNTNNKKLKDKWNSDLLYQSIFNVKSINQENVSGNISFLKLTDFKSFFKSFFKLFLPPVFLIIKRKIFNSRNVSK